MTTKPKKAFAAIVAALFAIPFVAIANTQAKIEQAVSDAVAENIRLQDKLSDRCSLIDYRELMRTSGGTNIWTDALQKALDEHEIVNIPNSLKPYFIDKTVVIPSNRRIEADAAAIIRVVDGMKSVLFRNKHAQDGTLAPVDATKRDDNIAIVGGCWEDWATRRNGGGRGGFNQQPRKLGNFYGVSTLMYFGSCDHLSIVGGVFSHAGGFAVQVGDANSVRFEDIKFDKCFADGLHLNGNLSRVLARRIRGQVGDDLVALNAYDWLGSSINFGPQSNILCEDLELVHTPGVYLYPAIRIQPAKYKYADGSIVDCSVSDVIFRGVRGIMTFKMYLQTPPYTIGEKPEWSEVGSGGNLFFEDIEIDLARPIDMFKVYTTSDPVRGHFAAFELGANLSSVNFKNIDITFHTDKYPLSHLLTVGPKSSLGGNNREVFDPYVSCHVGRVTMENIRIHGKAPEELVHATVFDDINKDGHSSGRGIIDKLEMYPQGKQRDNKK